MFLADLNPVEVGFLLNDTDRVTLWSAMASSQRRLRNRKAPNKTAVKAMLMCRLHNWSPPMPALVSAPRQVQRVTPVAGREIAASCGEIFVRLRRTPRCARTDNP